MDADRYITLMARRARPPLAAAPVSPPVLDPATRPVGVLQPVGESLVKRMLARVQWVAELMARARQPFDPDFCLHVVGSDSDWMDESGRFMKRAEAHVTELLKKNAARFAKFREEQKRGVAWPHNAQLRRNVEAAAFVFR